MKIFDTSSLICIFREIRFPKAFDICQKSGYALVITNQVYEEIQKNPETLQVLTTYEKFSVVPMEDHACFERLSKRFPWLHNGEVSILCLGLRKQKEKARYICIIDERARTLKDKLHIRIHGTVGLLLWQKERKDLDRNECYDLYKRFIESSFRIKKEILQELICDH
jgi:predicted nucleic acid-binding protein